jgi:glutamate-ammonia-ligase adenylyltransferase
VAVVALGKAGSREMTAKSDLDLMTLYAADDPAGMSAIKGWGAESFYARFTQRLTSALSAPTGEGTLYEVDLKLRPSGTKGPVAVSHAAFEDYYEREAETWELLALTRARVIWASLAGLPGAGRGGDRRGPAPGARSERRPPSTCWRCAS